MISLENVHKIYRRGDAETRALAGIGLSIAKGEFVSFMGPSGSGKSTLLHLIGALDRPSSGTLQVDGKELTQLDDKALTLLRRTRLGFVFQFFNLLTTMTALENAMLPALLSGKRESVAASEARGLLERVGLAHRLNHRPDSMSGGEMQRVAIARALVNQPAVLLADEPTGNLDTRNGVEVLRLLREATRERQVTVVMVTHDTQAAAVGDRVVHLQDGKIVSDVRGARDARDNALPAAR